MYKTNSEVGPKTNVFMTGQNTAFGLTLHVMPDDLAKINADTQAAKHKRLSFYHAELHQTDAVIVYTPYDGTVVYADAEQKKLLTNMAPRRMIGIGFNVVTPHGHTAFNVFAEDDIKRMATQGQLSRNGAKMDQASFTQFMQNDVWTKLDDQEPVWLQPPSKEYHPYQSLKAIPALSPNHS